MAFIISASLEAFYQKCSEYFHELIGESVFVFFAPLAWCAELYFDHHPPLWVDLLMKWTYRRPAALILRYSWKLIDTLAPCWGFSGFHITLHLHLQQLPLNPPLGDNRFRRIREKAYPGSAIDFTPHPKQVMKSIQFWPMRNKSPTE